MLISHRKKFIYTKTKKTAGTSVEVYFEKYCILENEYSFSHQRSYFVGKSGIIGCRGENASNYEYYNHMPAFEIKRKIGEELWGAYFKFCVIRNPFDKLVSQFFFRKEKGWIKVLGNGKEDLIMSFRHWIKEAAKDTNESLFMIDGEVCIDYFIRYENLNKGIEYVCNVLNIPFEENKIRFLKSNFRDRGFRFNELYDQNTIDIVRERNHLELLLFSYDFPDD